MTAQRPHKKPLRSCVACRVTDDKRRLVRFVRTAEGAICCDLTGRQPGRGAYLCGAERCFERARKGHLLDRALRIKLSEDDYENLAHAYRAAVAGDVCATIDAASAGTEGAERCATVGRENMV
ncbi:MAG: YlxR family protein [Coriobacteriales bacterium]|nr:YlxR family protein [Coriobacteriales bacterium]